MVKFWLIVGVLTLGLQAGALPKASDFKEIGADEEAEVTTPDAAESTDLAAKPPLAANEELVSGTVRVIRKMGMTEVFFKDLKDSYFIPSGANYSTIYKACQESEKKGQPVSFKVNSKSRRILSLEAAATATTTGAGGKK